MKNTYGSALALTIFGESHGAAIGAVLDGMAAGVPVDEARVAACMDKRRARGDGLSTARVEADQVQFLSGVVNGHTTGTAIALMILLQFIVHKTKTGKAMRAVSIDKDAAQLMGIRVDRTISFTFAIGSAFAGAAGVLVGIYYNSIDPLMGIMPGLKAFVAAVFGGIGSIPGAVIGAFIIGICENLLKGMKLTAFSDAFTFALLIVILVVKPTGLFGEKLTEKV